MRANTRAVGTTYERRAESYLRANGVVIVRRNFRCYRGEIDLIAREHDELIFVEVRQRADYQRGTAFETVNRDKQARIITGARAFLALRRPRFKTCRFDVIAFTGRDLTHFRDAFRIDHTNEFVRKRPTFM